MGELRNELELIGFPSDKTFSLKEVKKAFRRKSHLMLPEKSLGAQNAHSRFEELNAAFVKILHHFSESKGEDVSELVPGEIDVKRAMFVISIRKGSVPHWRRVIKGDLNMENFLPFQICIILCMYVSFSIKQIYFNRKM